MNEEDWPDMTRQAEEEQREKIPTAARVEAFEVKRNVTEDNLYPTYHGKTNLEGGNELVIRKDHEEKVAHERSRKYDEGFFEGRKSQTEEFEKLIRNKIEKMQNKRDSISNKDLEKSEIAKDLYSEYRAVIGKLEELLEEVQNQ